MSDTTRVVQIGLGPIGCAVARLVLERPGLELVGGVDVDPGKVGRDLGEVAGGGRRLGIEVAGSLAALEARADIALHTTGSYVDDVETQLLELAAAGLDVVSTTEELAFPWFAHAAAGQRIDAAARAAGTTVLATGVNPGFLLDSLPLALTSICQRVDHLHATRRINASERRSSFQKKIGAGLSRAAFEERQAGGRMGHVGLAESMAMIFDTLRRRLVRYESSVEPLLARREIETEVVRVVPGQVRGLRELARGFDASGEVVVLELIAALDLEARGDTISIRGVPELELELVGANGDLATVAMVVNAIPRVLAAGPGLVTMRDLPLPSA